MVIYFSGIESWKVFYIVYYICIVVRDLVIIKRFDPATLCGPGFRISYVVGDGEGVAFSEFS